MSLNESASTPNSSFESLGIDVTPTTVTQPSVDRYRVEQVPIDSIEPSPENDDVYGEVEHDETMEALISSIMLHGLEEPILVSSDGFVISGHRRLFACSYIGMEYVPIRRKDLARCDHLDQWPMILIEYNPQRVKTVASVLKESLLRFSEGSAIDALLDHRRASTEVQAEFLRVEGKKTVPDVSDKKREFLNAAARVVDAMRDYWPLSVRQIHYQLLNNPPLTSTPKKSKYPKEHYRYNNDQRSYDALVELLRQARYNGHISMYCIDDPTRPCFVQRGFTGVSEFISKSVDNFLCGYHRDRQMDQPRHIEVLGEKNTLIQILKPICTEYYVPLSLGRGYGSIPTWRNMARRFANSGKDVMTLIVASDFDPEGFDLADDAIRSLRDLFDIHIDYHRVGVKREQIDELNLASDFNPAKETSSRKQSFVDRTGDTRTWELEALPPDYLQEQVRAAIESNMDMSIYEETIRQERRDAQHLQQVRAEIAGSMGL